MLANGVPVEALADGGHACCYYDTDEEQRGFVTEFVRAGLASGHKVISVADGGSTRRILDDLLEEPMTAAAAKRGQLVVRRSEDAYVAAGFFDPDRMLAWWARATAQALDEGYPGLRATGDVTWYARGLPGVERLMDYERALSDTLAGAAASALCQYDRRRLSDDMLAEASTCHEGIATPPQSLSPLAFRVLGSVAGGFRLVGELDVASVNVLSDALGAVVTDGVDALTLDLAGLRFIDAAGAATLVRPAVDHGVALCLRRPRPIVRKVLTILGAERLPQVRLDLSRDDDDGI